MAKLDVTLEPSNAPELPKEWRDKIKNLIDVEAHYLEQTWDLMQRKIKDRENWALPSPELIPNVIVSPSLRSFTCSPVPLLSLNFLFCPWSKHIITLPFKQRDSRDQKRKNKMDKGNPSATQQQDRITNLDYVLSLIHIWRCRRRG